ncbi:claudin-4-like [Synchiropus picturatus]
MVSAGRQFLGFSLAAAGLLGSVVACALPTWRVTAFIGANIVTAQVVWEGLWMNCVSQSTGQMQCKVYSSLLSLSRDVQAARALTVTAAVAALFGMLVGSVGGRCTTSVADGAQKLKLLTSAGIIFLLAGLLVLVPVSWTAHIIIRDFYNPMLIPAQKRELGAALYVGWGSAAALFLGGGLLCSSCPSQDDRDYDVTYTKAPAEKSSRSYV